MLSATLPYAEQAANLIYYLLLTYLLLTYLQAANLIALQSKYQVSNERISEYKTIFSFFDADGGGSIDRDEFRFAMRCIDEEMSEVSSK